MRGYCGIGIYGPKNSLNMGTLWRSAHILGAAYIFTIGQRYRRQPGDTMNATSHVPMFNWGDFDEFYCQIPNGAQLVGIELTEDAIPLAALAHPERAVYLLGAEDWGLPEDILHRCHKVIRLPGARSINVAVAGSIVLYDRLQKATK